MYTFIPTHANPTLSELTSAHELLRTAVDNVASATSEARKTGNDLYGAEHAKRPSMANLQTRRVAARVAAIREQSVREPLQVAMGKMQKSLVTVTEKKRSAWPFWQQDAYRINVIASFELLKRAVEVYGKIFPADMVPHSNEIYEHHDQARAALSAVPQFPEAGHNAWDFLMKCLGCALRHSGGGVVSLRDEQCVSTVGRLLQQAGWEAEEQGFMGEGMTPGFELSAPKAFTDGVRLTQ